MSKNTPLVLMILDGWGYREGNEHNAIAAASTPQWDEWWNTKPHILLNASGHEVGLPDEQMGNSEVGHMHIGAGRIVHQDFSRINEAIAQGTFAENPVLNELIEETKSTSKTLHIMGLLSTGGVHSHENHLFALLALCTKHQFTNIALHLFLDGRDTPPQSALDSIARLKHQLCSSGAKIKSLTGRYFAMDRDQRWERIAELYQLLTEAHSKHHFNSVEEAIDHFYQLHITDEFIPPTLIGEPQAIEDGDAILFFNFRADRARQLSQCFVDKAFEKFPRKCRPQISQFVTMTQYAKNLNTKVIFPTEFLSNTLGEILAAQDLRQLRLAETEKYAHVTFFFNGGSEQVFPGEKRILVPSPSVATYDLSPEMSANELTDELIKAIEEEAFDVIICNYANADMVGHSGNLAATIKAIECLDHCMQRVGQALAKKTGVLLITADHGNAEAMFDEHTQQAHTAHTCQPVPLVFVANDKWQFKQEKGSLIDIAPTILALLGIPKPKEMTGQALLVKTDDSSN